MPRERESITHKFSIAGHEGYITAGKYEDGSVGEIFLTDIGKEGSTLRGMMNAFATAISIGLQYGVPLETFVKKFSYMRFDPEGITNNPEIPFAKSMPDYIMRWVASRFIEDLDELEDLGILTKEVRARKEAQLAMFTDDTAGPANGGNGHGNGHANGSARTARGDHPPAGQDGRRRRGDDRHPAGRPGEGRRGRRPRSRLRAVRRDDAAHGLLLHVLELRQQHRLRVSQPAANARVDDRLGGRAVRRRERLDQVALAADEHAAQVGELAEALDAVVAARAALADAAEGQRRQRAVHGGGVDARAARGRSGAARRRRPPRPWRTRRARAAARRR